MWKYLSLLSLGLLLLCSPVFAEENPKEIVLTWEEYQQVRSLFNELKQQLTIARMQLSVAKQELTESKTSLTKLSQELEAEQKWATTRDTIRRIGAGVTLLGICTSVVGIFAPSVVPAGVTLAVGGVTLAVAVFTVAWSP